MSAKSLRSFALGLIIAASVSGIGYYSTKDEPTIKKEVVKPSAEEMKESLLADGYVIHTEKEWNEHLAKANEEKAKAEEKAKEEPKKEEPKKEAEKEKIVYRTTITVEDGMTSIDVGRALKKAHIIKEPMDLVKEVEKRKLEKKLKPGSYEVDSNMDMNEAISKIFK